MINDLRVGGKFRLIKKIGYGSFGDIYKGHNVKSFEDVAIKLVSNNFNYKFQELKDERFPQIPYEAKIYQMLDANKAETQCITFRQ